MSLPNLNRCAVCGGILSKPKGQTYIIQRQGWVKIGKSTNVAARLRSLTRQVPVVLTPHGMDWSAPLTVLTVIPRDIEHALHEALSDLHVIGEWFRADASVLVKAQEVAA